MRVCDSAHSVLPCMLTAVLTPTTETRRERETQFDLFSGSLDVSCRSLSLGEGWKEVKLKINYRLLKYTNSMQHMGLWPLYLGLSPSYAALSRENVNPSFFFSLYLFCFSSQVTQDSYETN